MSGPRLNPFQPDQRARVSIFTGRAAERQLVSQSVVDALRGRASHVLLVGERGMGKTSLARYVAELAVSEPTLSAAGGVPAPAVLFVSLGYAPTVDEASAAILDAAYRWARERSSPAMQWFQERFAKVSGLTVGWFGINFHARDDSRSSLPRALPDALVEFARVAKVSGLVIILDETEAISGDTSFPSFVKSTLETLTVRNAGTIELVMTMTPEGRDRAAAAHGSFLRLFRIANVGPLTQDEVLELVPKTLAEGLPRKTAAEEFVELVAHYSSGIPSFVHEIGRAAFEVDTDDVLSKSDFGTGLVGTENVIGALQMLEEKHFRERYSKKILSNTYRTILHAMAIASADLATDEISVEEIRKRTGPIDGIGTYLSNMTKRGVIARVDGKKGLYRLPDRMLGVFLRMADSKRLAKRASP